MSASAVSVTLGIMVLTTSALLLFHATAHPDVSVYGSFFPQNRIGGVLLGGAAFAVLNSIMEEVVFRGVLFDAVHSQWGVWGALLGTAALFGIGHLHGYPPGVWGGCLAALFGFGMGILRWWTGGLLLPIIAHIGADATIYSILVHAGAL